MEAIAIHEGRKLDKLLSDEEKFVRVVRQYEKEGRVDSFTSLADLIPSLEKQARVARSLREAIDLERVRKHFIKLLEENGFEVSHFQPFIQSLENLSQGQETIFLPETLIASLEQGPLKRGVERLLTRTGDTYRVVSHLYYKKGNLSLDQLERELSGISITGPERVESEILRIVREDLFVLTPAAFLIIFFLVFLHFRAWRTTLFTLLPLIMGLIWMMGAMSILGIRINFVNAVVLPMIIGMGIDNGVHLMHRSLEGGGKEVSVVLRTTGRAMILCSLTTMLGFGSLVTARYQALSTMGWMTILGMGFCLVTSLCFLPVLLFRQKEKHGKRENL
jgi:predicted exporter